MTKQHISFSELKTWAECPFKHKLQYIDKIKGFTGNVFTAFGTAIHSVCEHIAKGELDPIDYDEHFDLAFLYELKKLDDKPDNKMITQMRQQGREISPSVFPQLKEHFGKYDVFSTEEMLYVPIEELTYKWHLKGFIDLVIKTEDGKYHILDWKSCSWGWKAEKRSEKLVTYQLTLYKKFFCQKHNIEPSLVETHFGLLKRTAKENKVEIFRVTSGSRKTKSATKLLTDGCRTIKASNFVKNRKSCSRCDFNKTEHCP
tara:strand:- start:34460 stop:35233 length:774 start_codon:yes stop_codon:yes gene_type:complete